MVASGIRWRGNEPRSPALAPHRVCLVVRDCGDSRYVRDSGMEDPLTAAIHKIHLANENQITTLCGRELIDVIWSPKKGEATCNACRLNAGLTKSPRVPRSLNPRPSKEPPVAVGQTWEDIKARSEGRKRRIRVVSVDEHHVYFLATTDVLRIEPRKALRERFCGNMRGYRHVGEQEE